MKIAPILYIEDELDYQILVKRMLKKAGLDVITADSGAEGLQQLLVARPSVLLLDINLPDTDGYDFCRRLREDPSWADLPILMVTIRRRPEEWLRGFSSGASDYLSKPLNPPELVDRVFRALKRRRRPDLRRKGPEFNLIQAAADGNRAAFTVLIHKYQDRLLESLKVNVSYDARAEDAVSAAFLQAYKHLDQFRGEASFYTWLYRIALNFYTGAERKAAALSLDDLDEEQEGLLLNDADILVSTEETLASRELQERAKRILQQIPGIYQKVLELFFLQNIPYEAIARKLRVPLGTVMSRMHKARRLFQDAWHASEKKEKTLR